MKNKSTPTAANQENDGTDRESDADTLKLESAIGQTRASMGETIDQLHGKLNPGVLKEQVLDQFHQAKEAVKTDLRSEIDEVKGHLRQELADAKSEFREATIGKVEHMVDDVQQTVTKGSTTLVSVIRENPIPMALVGIGIGWLFINARARGARNGSRTYMQNGAASQGGRNRVEDFARQAGSRANQLAHQVGDRAGSLLKSSEGRAGSMLHSAQDQAQHALGQATDKGLSIAHDARDTAVRWEGTIERTLRESPLPLGAIALAVGVAVGFAVPSTRIEDQWVGEYRDQAVDEAEQLAEKALGTIESGAKQLAESAKSGSEHQESAT